MFRPLLLAVAIGPAAPIHADPTPPPRPAADAGPPEFEARFADDSTVKVVLLDPTVTVTTKYGPLTLPLADVKRVEVGFRYPPGAEAKVEAAVAALGAAAFRERDEAEKALFGFGELAAPAVRRARRSSDPEVASRAEAVWKKLQDKLPADKLERKDFDTIEAEFPIRGRLDPAALRVRSRYFGEGEMKLAELRSLRSVTAPTGVATIALDAARYAKLNWAAWMDTGVDVSTDAPLEITATGQIDQWPQEPGKYMVGPQGGSGQVRMPNNPAMPAASGAVFGRIGPGGQPFLVGAGYRPPQAPAAGRLFLIIAPSHWGNNDCSGAYQVKVKVRGGE